MKIGAAYWVEEALDLPLDIIWTHEPFFSATSNIAFSTTFTLDYRKRERKIEERKRKEKKRGKEREGRRKGKRREKKNHCGTRAAMIYKRGPHIF